MITGLLIIAGLILVVLGADFLVDGASAVARKAGISEFVICLTIIGFGTSCPELVVSLTGAIEGNPDISIGNVVGSNIFNTLLILGLTAVLAPVAVTKSNARRDIPITLGVTVLLIAAGYFLGVLNWITGIVFLAVFVVYMIYCFKSDSADSHDDGQTKEIPVWRAVLLIIAGLAALVFGGRLFVDNSVILAKSLGVSDKFIAVTLLAGGTSLPELATCVVAAIKKKDQLALGNILGSNVFNILLILGCASLVTPLSFEGMSLVDNGVLLLSMLLVLMSTLTGKRDRIERWEGALMLLLEVAYMAYLIYSR